MSSSLTQDQDLALPVLREDLQLVQGPPEADGSPTWTIFDPIRNKYFRIGWAAFQLLSRWSVGQVAELAKKVSDNTTCEITNTDVLALMKFLHANNLTKDSVTGGAGAYLAQYKASKPHWLMWLVHNYLFIRIPLVRPHRFLQATSRFVEPLFTKATRNTVIVIGLTGMFLVSRQWETFVNTFLYFFTFEAIAFYGIALVFTKILHELGHAYTATRYGCRIPTMGVAFLVLFPVLYTDATDAWRLTLRRQRLFIGAAGMLTELSVALICTFLWNFLPDGVLRSAAFITATTSWVTTLLINLNPFMRFDGYYILTDLLGVHNLQERSFALARWKLRRLLFGVDDPVPERFERSTYRKLILYAWGTWIYRFFLFIGIAVLVYYFFFKILGILLFIVEIIWFILLPIFRELKVWWQMRNRTFTSRRFVVTATILTCLLLLAFIPWSTRVSFPALLETTSYATVFAPEPGRIVKVLVKEGRKVEKGDVLLRLESPRLEDEIKRTKRQIEVLRLRYDRIASNPDDLANVHVVLQEYATQASRLAGLQKKRQNLVIRASMPGVATDVDDALHPGRWINNKLALAFIIDPSEAELKGLVAETEIARLEKRQSAEFFPDDFFREPIQGTVVEISQTNMNRFKTPYLASLYGGEVAVREDDEGNLVPESSVYEVRISAEGQLPSAQVVRGVVHVQGHRRSFARRTYDLVASVLIRESGF